MRIFTHPLKSWTKSLSVGALLLSAVNFNAQPGAALNFDGSNDYVNLGTAINGSLSALNKITVETWVRPTNLTGLGDIIGNYTSPATQMQFLMRRNTAASYEFFIGNGNGGNYIQVTSVAVPTVNVWQHLAGTWDGTVASIYVNGALSATASITYPAMGVCTNSVWIGSNSINEAFAGDIDEVRIWNRKLCPSEINNNRLAELTLPQFGLIAYYKMNQGTAGANNAGLTSLTDASPGATTGTLTNFALTGATSNWVTPGGVTSGSIAPAFLGNSITVNSGSIIAGQVFTIMPSGGVNYTFSSGSSTVSPVVSSQYTVYGYDVPGGCLNKAVSTVSVPGASFKFDGVNDYVNLGTAISPSLNNSPVLTVESWVKPSVLTGTGAIVNNHFGGTQFCLRRDLDHYAFFVGFGTYGLNSAVGTATTNAWQHVAAVFNNTIITLYINGAVASTTTIPAYSLVASTNSLYIANDGFSEYFTGDIDEVRIWKRALCQAEIQNNMNAELALPKSGLLNYYKFNQGMGALANPTQSTLIDATGAVTGTLMNTALTGTTSNWNSPGGVVSGSIAPTFAIPAFSVAGTTAYCQGGSTTLTASGVNSYSWSTGITTSTIALSPTVTTAYSVVGTSTATGCQAVLMPTVTVNQNPTITANSGTICSGSSFTITPGGAGVGATYTIQGGVAVVSPTMDTNYTVVGTSSAGCVGSNTATASVTVVICTGINEVHGILSETSLYPNPANGIFTLSLPVNADVVVFNALGKQVFSQQLQAGKNNINLQQAAGVYFVRVSKNDSQITYKLIVE